MTKDSRLEKFLKALCSLDYSDLPTPLSRVEVLWNCLITGEATPDFQPQSRTEKYLMTILGVYDLDDTPKPISRAETLLYKLATGDTDVELEDGAKSRYERLLSEIVVNGGVGDNVDFEYVTYVLSESFNTLYNTVEKPVESAILKGQTLVNAAKIKTAPMLSSTQYSLTDMMLKGNTKYIFFFTHGSEDNNAFVLQEYKAEVGWIINHHISLSKLTPRQHYIFTTKEETRMLKVQNTSSTEFPCGNFMIIEYQEGMENWDIPYFEGMQSVKMPVLTTSNEDGTKTNILTVNEEVELRGIGGVQDTLDLMTGELTQRIGEMIVDDSNGWWFATNTDGSLRTGKHFAEIKSSSKLSCDLLPTIVFNQVGGQKGVAILDQLIIIYTGHTNKEGLKSWVQQNPLTIQYELATESIKTVDLSTLEQDGNKTELKTFDDITNVSLSSEGLIPEAEMTVVTKNLDDISQVSTMSLRMNDISDRQNELQNEVDTQSENIDSTMMATTEIYEQTL